MYEVCSPPSFGRQFCRHSTPNHTVSFTSSPSSSSSNDGGDATAAAAAVGTDAGMSSIARRHTDAAESYPSCTPGVVDGESSTVTVMFDEDTEEACDYDGALCHRRHGQVTPNNRYRYYSLREMHTLINKI